MGSHDCAGSDDFLAWGRKVVNASALRIEEKVAGARRGSESSLDGYEAIYVHFRDPKLPQDLAVWIYAARAGSANSVPGYRDAVGIGLKRDSDEELKPGEWTFRSLTPLSWRRHVDDRYEGYCRGSKWGRGGPGDRSPASTENP